MADVNLAVISTSPITLSKGSSVLYVSWAGIQTSNWVNATMVSTDDDSNIKTKWQRRMIDSDGHASIKIGFDNDSDKKVTGFAVIMADADFSASGLSREEFDNVTVKVEEE